MSSLLANNKVILFMALFFGVLGLLIGYKFQDFMWFARSGALVVAMGLILFSRASIIGKDIKIHIVMEETGLSHLDPEHYKKTNQPMPEWLKEDLKSRYAVGVLAPIVSFIGTVIWGFGDLFNNFVTTTPPQ